MDLLGRLLVRKTQNLVTLFSALLVAAKNAIYSVLDLIELSVGVFNILI